MDSPVSTRWTIVVARNDGVDGEQDAEDLPKDFALETVPRQQVFVVESPQSQMKSWLSKRMIAFAPNERPEYAYALRVSQ